MCFTHEALVRTSIGSVPISKIQRDQTIVVSRHRSGNVSHAIRVVNASPTMIQIAKDTLGTNYPNRDTTLTPEHRIMLRDGLWYRAGDLLTIDGVTAIESEPNQYVYHLAVTDCDTMSVDGLAVETLDPNNINVQMRTRKINLTTGTAETI